MRRKYAYRPMPVRKSARARLCGTALLVLLSSCVTFESALAQQLPAAAASNQNDASSNEEIAYELERLPPVESGEEPGLPLSESWESAPSADATNQKPRQDRGLGGPPGRDRSPLGVRSWWIPTQDIDGQPGQLSMQGVELNLAFPMSISPDGIWLATGGVERMEIQSTALLPDSGQPVPEELWNIQFGAMHFRELDNGWRAGGIAMVGSPSDRPFESTRDMTVTTIGFLTVPSGERDAWSFSLMYSPTGQLTFPIPGVSYIWKPNDSFTANIGVPFSLHYEPNEQWSFDASYTPLTNGQVLATRKLGEAWSLYGGYRTVNETFLLADRANINERLYLFDQRLLLGAKRPIFKNLELDFSVAYVFDRKLFQSEQFTSDRIDQLNIDPGVAGILQLGWKR